MFVFMFLVIMPQYSTGYNAALIDKYDRLVSLDEPKIILVGDSSVAYGFDSVRIEQAFGMPVVNFGLNRDLGQQFYTNLIKPHIRENDIIVIAPAGFDDYAVSMRDPVVTLVTLENNFHLWRGVPLREYYTLLHTFPIYLNRAAWHLLTNSGNQPVQGHNSRTAFNEQGDIVYPRPNYVDYTGYYGIEFDGDQLSEHMTKYWNDYNEFVISRGASLFMSSPPILDSSIRIDLDLLQRQLDEDLNFPMISRLEDYAYPVHYFLDTYAHLNDSGVDVRTEQFIFDLSNALAN